MTMTMKNTKNEMIQFLQSKNVNANFNKMTKLNLFTLCEKYVEINENEIALIENENKIAIVENVENIKNENVENENIENDTLSMYDEYISFLYEQNAIFKIENDIIIVIANKKHIFVKIDDDKNYSYVFTILNKKMSNDLHECKKHARNILTLKSIRATKSYTISNMK
jgi:hypothetical protein